MPGMVWPAPMAGDPPPSRRSLDERNIGLALNEFRSLWVCVRQAASVVTSFTQKLRNPLTLPGPVL